MHLLAAAHFMRVSVILKGADRVYGPHKYVQVVVARSIIGKWRQPIYYDFDQKVTKELLFSIISSIEDAGFPVHACVRDMEGPILDFIHHSVLMSLTLPSQIQLTNQDKFMF